MGVPVIALKYYIINQSVRSQIANFSFRGKPEATEIKTGGLGHVWVGLHFNSTASDITKHLLFLNGNALPAVGTMQLLAI